MKKSSKIISYILVGCFVFSNGASFVFATMNHDSLHTKNNQFLELKTTPLTQAENISTSSLSNMTSVVNDLGKLIPGLYFIPGIGEVLITTTGAIIVAGITVVAGSLLYNTIKTYFAEHTKNKRPSTYDKHTKPSSGRQTEKKKLKNKWEQRGN